MKPRSRIARIELTPVAFADAPLLNVIGLHEPFALRAIVALHTDSGVSGYGETYADQAHLDRLVAVAARLVGHDLYDLNGAYRIVAETLGHGPGNAGASFGGTLSLDSAVDTVFSPFEVACLDAQGRELDRPVSDLLGGAVRERVPFSGYLFYRWAAHPGGAEDGWGEALNPEQLVAQARRMVADYGFGALKLKGGVFPPDHEAEAIEALAEAFPGVPLRLDPNGAWTPGTGIAVANRLAGVLEYLEDPSPGLAAMAEVSARSPVPLATNMCVIAFDQVPAAVATDAVQIVLADHHLWGGLRRSILLAGLAETFGLGLSMHSNSHLGISLAAMTHLAAACPRLSYACDTHYPWKSEDVIAPGELAFVDGSVSVPTGAGLGVSVLPERVAELHEQYLACGQRGRHDTAYYRRFVPDFQPNTGRW